MGLVLRGASPAPPRPGEKSLARGDGVVQKQKGGAGKGGVGGDGAGKALVGRLPS